jgi:tetratricopeptide (TPR) repeat protein
MKMKSVFIAFAISLLILLPCCGFTAEDFTSQYYDLREKEIRQFGLDLFTAGEYYRAITEAKRYLSLFPKGPQTAEMAKLIGDSYLMSHEWVEAIAAYEDFLLQYPTSSLAGTVTFHTGIALVKQGNAVEAERLFQLILSGADPAKKADAARWEIILLIRQNHFDEAEKLLKDRMLPPEVEKQTEIIEDILKSKKSTRYKSPETAGILSAIFPGSGQFYNGRYQDGIYSLLLNAMFILGAYKAYDADNYGLGGVLTLFEIGWYTGGIYGAIGGAHKYNRQIEEDSFRTGLQSLNLQKSEIGRPGGVSVIFSFPF